MKIPTLLHALESCSTADLISINWVNLFLISWGIALIQYKIDHTKIFYIISNACLLSYLHDIQLHLL